MKIETTKFIKSVTRLEDLPEAGPPEIAFAGRSNVGKSSLLNALCRVPGLARTSSTPGRTQALNYFLINDDEFYFVDLPGYGYAKVSKKDRERWGRMIEGYVTKRETLVLLVLLIDARIPLMDSDRDALLWMWQNDLPVLVALTKTDDVKQHEIAGMKNKIHTIVEDVTIIATSAKKGTGIGELVKIISEATRDH